MSLKLIKEIRVNASRENVRSTLENIWALLVVTMGSILTTTRSRKGISTTWMVGIIIGIIAVGGIIIAFIVLTPSGTTTTVPYP